MLHLHLSSTAIFMLTALLNLLIACLPPSRGLTAENILLLLIPILSIFLMEKLTSIFTLWSLTLVNSENLFLSLFFQLPKLFQKRSVKTPLMLSETPPLAFISPTAFFAGSGDKRDFFFRCSWPVPFQWKRKRWNIYIYFLFYLFFLHHELLSPAGFIEAKMVLPLAWYLA